MTDELKPVRCGCGGEARIGKIYGDAWTVECTECGIQSGCYDTEAEAITAWNRAMGGVVSYPCTNPNGVYTSGCTITNTTDPNEDFHPVRDCMVGKERTAKAEWSEVDGCHLCGECGFAVTPHCDVYCSHCGVRLKWGDDE